MKRLTDSKRALLCSPCLTRREFMSRLTEYHRGERCDGCRRVTKVAQCMRRESDPLTLGSLV